MNKYNRKQIIDIILIELAIISLLLPLVCSYYGVQLYKILGLHVGDAANIFAFNVSIFIPLILLSVLLSLIVNYRTAANWKKRPVLWMKLIPLIISFLILFLFVFLFIMFLRAGAN